MLVVLIEFGGYKSSKEVAAGGFTLSGYPDLTSEWPSATNDDVTAVSTIDLSSAVTTFIMSGGTADVEYPQGKVASVTLTSDFISSASAMTKVSRPRQHFVPTELGRLTSLQQLLLDYNYITTVDSLDVIDSIITLSIESNSLTTFSGTLNLTGNSFTSRSFTKDQAEFLNNLETLVLTASDFTVGLDCDDMDQVVIHDVTVRLSDVVATSASSSAGADGSKTQTTSSSGSSSTSLTLGIACGVLAVISAAILFFFYRRKKKNFVDSKLSSTADDHFPSSSSDREQRQQTYGQLRTSTGVPMGIPMSTSGVAMGIPTETEADASTGIATTDESSTYQLTSLDAAPLRKKPHTFLSIWSDPELLSLQVRVEDIEDVKQLGSGAFATVWLVRYRKSQLLASKRLRPGRRTKKHTSNFVEEINFGALLTELDTNQIPYSNARGSNGKILTDMTILHRVATGKLHPEVRSTCNASVKDLVERCLVEDPFKRPAATVIAYELRVIQKDMAATL
ncbi:hypothetical protein PI125_g22462 [Phytophthora idaei]|nr:hypothetical protein PI125_g22462 [Phytophthora idaei]